MKHSNSFDGLNGLRNPSVLLPSPFRKDTEDCKLVVTCKMQNRNATDKLNPQCSKLALFANTITVG